MDKVDVSKLRRVDLSSPSAKFESLQKPPKKKKKGRRTKQELELAQSKPGGVYWRDKADAEWKKLIHLTYSCCLVCGKSNLQLHSHHLIGRAKPLTRQDPKNGVLLCAFHHVFSPEISPHNGPVGFSEFLKENHPERFEYILKNLHQVGKPDYKDAYEILRKKVKSFI